MKNYNRISFPTYQPAKSFNSSVARETMNQARSREKLKAQRKQARDSS